MKEFKIIVPEYKYNSETKYVMESLGKVLQLFDFSVEYNISPTKCYRVIQKYGYPKIIDGALFIRREKEDGQWIVYEYEYTDDFVSNPGETLEDVLKRYKEYKINMKMSLLKELLER